MPLCELALYFFAQPFRGIEQQFELRESLKDPLLLTIADCWQDAGLHHPDLTQEANTIVKGTAEKEVKNKVK